MGLLEDKVVLVNGGSQGVGAGIVRAAVREGATVVVHRPPCRGRREARGGHRARTLRTGRPGGPGAGARRRGPGGRGPRPDRLPGQRGRADLARLAARHHARTVRPAHRDQPARAVLRHAGGGGRHGGPQGARHHRQHRLQLRARRPAAPGPVLRRQGRPGGPDPQRGPRPPLGPHPDQRPQHRLDGRPRARTRPSAPSTARATTGASRPPSACRWASSARSTRSPTSSSCCSPTAAAW